MTPPPAAAALAAALETANAATDPHLFCPDHWESYTYAADTILAALAASGWQLAESQPSAVGVTREGEGLADQLAKARGLLIVGAAITPHFQEHVKWVADAKAFLRAMPELDILAALASGEEGQ